MEQERQRPVWKKTTRKKRRKKRKLNKTHLSRTNRTNHTNRTPHTTHPKQSKQFKRLKTYAIRAITLLILTTMLFLMLCGCLYIRDFFRENKAASPSNSTPESLSTPDPSAQKTAAPYTIILDAGHGGNDSGTIEQSTAEKDINLSIALKMKELLEQKNIQVILTRDKDIFMELEERTEIAKNEEADLFLSIHCNYYEDDSSIRGLECYYSQDSSDGEYYAEKLIESLEEKGDILSRNAKPAEYFVLKNTNIPSVLVETGYLSNYADRKDLTSQNYQEKLAAELVEGILKGLRDKKSEPK